MKQSQAPAEHRECERACMCITQLRGPVCFMKYLLICYPESLHSCLFEEKSEELTVLQQAQQVFDQLSNVVQQLLLISVYQVSINESVRFSQKSAERKTNSWRLLESTV